VRYDYGNEGDKHANHMLKVSLQRKPKSQSPYGCLRFNSAAGC
jgi:hypothetical protein